MSSQVHPQAQKGFSVNTSNFYDKVRPSYPAEALSHIREAVGSKDGLNVVEIGSGTGIFTRALLTHPQWSSSVAALTAVEPSEGMRNTFKSAVKDDRVSLKEGTFNKTGVPDGWADCLVMAQAFHWCLDHQEAMTEFARILRPQGIIALVWNSEDRERVAWIRQVFELSGDYDAARRVHTNEFRWRESFDAPAFVQNFDGPEENNFQWTDIASLDIVTDRVMSWSPFATLDGEEKAKVKEKVQSIVKRGDGLKWINEEQGLFEIPYSTLVVIVRRK